MSASRDKKGALGLLNSLPESCRKNAVFYTDFWSAYKEIHPPQGRHFPVGKRNFLIFSAGLPALPVLISILSMRGGTCSLTSAFADVAPPEEDSFQRRQSDGENAFSFKSAVHPVTSAVLNGKKSRKRLLNFSGSFIPSAESQKSLF